MTQFKRTIIFLRRLPYRFDLYRTLRDRGLPRSYAYGESRHYLSSDDHLPQYDHHHHRLSAPWHRETYEPIRITEEESRQRIRQAIQNAKSLG